MLETIRELALEELAAAGEEQAIRARHAAGASAWPRRAARTGAAALVPRGSRTSDASARTCAPRSPGAHRTTATWSRRCGSPRRCCRSGSRTASSTRASGSSPRCSRAPPSPTVGRARALAAAGWLAGIEADVDRYERAGRESLALLPAGEDWYRAVCLNLLGTMARLDGRLAEARQRYEEALGVAAERDLWWPTALAWANLGTLAELEGRHREALESHEQLGRDRARGRRRWMAATCMVNLGRAASHAGDVERAIALHGEALRAFVRARQRLGRRRLPRRLRLSGRGSR